jgi:hypothetical protein
LKSRWGSGRIVGKQEVISWILRRTPSQIRLGHESLDVTLAFLKGKDAESEEALELM